MSWKFFRGKSKAVVDVQNKGQKNAQARSTPSNKDQIKSDIILSSIEDGVVMIDDQGVIQSFNHGAEVITAWNANDTVNLDYRSIFKFSDKKGEIYSDRDNPITKAFYSKEPVRDNEVEYVTQNDKHIPIFISSTPIYSQTNGKLEAIVSVFRDVSKERNEESQRAEFISTASHEMRTPVAAIEGYLALALNDAVCKIDSKARDYLEKAHTSTNHLGQLFQDLLTAAKTEDGRITNNPVVVEMSKFVQEVAEANRFVAEKKGLLVDYAIGGSSKQAGSAAIGSLGQSKSIHPLYYCHVDPDRIREVLTNLFDNAVKYSDTGKITFSLTGNDDVVQIKISDNGPGIPAEDIPHLFQKFYRVDNSTTRTVGGTGLGLFISRKIVELYGGKIWAESELDEGSTFIINLPRLSTAKASEMQTKEDSQPKLSSLTSF